MPPMGSEDIAADIAGRIVRGEWQKDQKLPTTEALAARYNCGKRTIDDAMRILKLRGIVRGVRGGGRYVA